MAARGNCGPQPHTAKLQVDSVPSGEPICSLAFDPSLAPQHDGVPMHIGQFVLSWTANLSFSRDEQIPKQSSRIEHEAGRRAYAESPRRERRGAGSAGGQCQPWEPPPGMLKRQCLAKSRQSEA